MTERQTTLHLLCGKIAAGKSTLAAQLGAAPDTVIVAEDSWLSLLYPDELEGLEDYVRASGRLRAAMAPHLRNLLSAGLSVVLDFPANTPKQRAWMRDLIRDTGVAHRLHYLDVPDEICRDRLRRRNAEGGHEFQVSDAIFDQVTRHFTPPAPEEGFDVTMHRSAVA